MNLNHLYLRVADLDRSVAFYRDYFEFGGPSGWQGETFVITNGEGFSLALTPDPAPPPWPAGLHYGFLLDEVETARRLLRRLDGPLGRRGRDAQMTTGPCRSVHRPIVSVREKPRWVLAVPRWSRFAIRARSIGSGLWSSIPSVADEGPARAAPVPGSARRADVSVSAGTATQAAVATAVSHG